MRGQQDQLAKTEANREEGQNVVAKDQRESYMLAQQETSTSLPAIAETSFSNKQGKSILVLINPHSGRGKSVSIYKKKLLPLLNRHEIDHYVFITESDSRVFEYLMNKSLIELINLKSIIVVAGDGLFHEALNALMARDDNKQAISVPIGIIPAGSGNGMAYSLLRNKHSDVSSKSDAIRLCCEQAIQDETCLADLVKITFGQQKLNEHNKEATATRTIWSFLSIGWGLLSDIDIDSEWLRSLGEFRFTLYGLLRSFTSASYRGRLSFKVAIATERLNNSRRIGEQSKENSRLKMADILEFAHNGIMNESNALFKMHAKNTHDKDRPLTRNDGMSYLDYYDGEDDNYKDWIHIEDDFTCLYAVYQSYISSVTKFAPKSTLTDQLIYLTYVRGRLSFFQTIRFLLDIEDGSHENLPYVTVVPVTCFKFQPLEDSKIVVDGEVIAWNLADGPITAEVVPKVMKLVWDPQKGN